MRGKNKSSLRAIKKTCAIKKMSIENVNHELTLNDVDELLNDQLFFFVSF